MKPLKKYAPQILGASILGVALTSMGVTAQDVTAQDVTAQEVAAQDVAVQDADAPAGSQVRGTKELVPCHIATYRQEVLCGTHRVFEDRAAGSGREIDIEFAILPAVGENPLPDPVLVFAGGPGQSAISMSAFVNGPFKEVLESRDIVLIDQRGMGASHPLPCESPEEPMTLTPEALREESARILGQCLESWEADISLYTQDIANEDIHEISLALGYEKVNLFGGSWGTRSALLYAHRYPEQVRTVLLDGALPLVNTAPMHAGADGESALRGLFEDCAANGACAEAFPDLEGDYRRVLSRLEAAGGAAGETPMTTIMDPVTSSPVDVAVTPGVFGSLVFGALYVAEIGRILPWAIHQAAEGDYRPIFGIATFASGMSDSMTVGATLAIFCAEEIARFPETELPESLVGHELLGGIRHGCAVMEEAGITFEAPAIYSENPSSDAPTLILSGARDPITPPRWGDEMAKVFSNSLHLVAPYTGHNASPVGCSPELITEFIESGDVAGLDGSCLEEIERPSFFVDASGPSMELATVAGGAQ